MIEHKNTLADTRQNMQKDALAYVEYYACHISRVKFVLAEHDMTNMDQNGQNP